MKFKAIQSTVRRLGRKSWKTARKALRAWARGASGELRSGQLMGRGHSPQPWEGQPRRDMTPGERRAFGQVAGCVIAQAEAIQLRRELGAMGKTQFEDRKIRRL